MARRVQPASPVRTTVERAVGRITLARGAAGNPLDRATQEALVAAADGLRSQPEVRVVVLEAEGPRFSVGAAGDTEDVGAVDAIAAIEQPVVAAVQGMASGLGFALVLAADIVVADSTVRLQASDPRQGRLAGGGLVQRLVRVVGPTRASELLLLGTVLRARSAYAWGLVQRLTRPQRARATAVRVATRLAARAPLANRYAKEACRRALDLPLDDGLRLEHDLYVMLQTTVDRRAGVQAFLEGRTPRFDGR